MGGGDQHRNEAEALRASERRLSLAAEAAGLGIWDWDLRTGEMIYSDRAKAIYGFDSGAEVTFEAVRDATHPEDLPFTLAKSERALDPTIREKSPYHYRLLRQDGSLCWVLAHGEAVFEEVDGVVQAVRYVGSLQDVTDRKEAAEALSTSEESLRLAQEAGGIGTWSLDLLHPECNRWSPQLYKIRGMPEDWRPSYSEWLDRVHFEDRARVDGAFQRAFAGEGDIGIVYRFIGSDGEERWQESRGSVGRLTDGTAVGANGITMDITERKRTEQALAESVERLRLATEGTGLGLYDLDLVNDVGIWSTPTFEMLGLPVPPDQKADSATWRRLVHPDDVERVAEEHARAAKAGGSWRIQYRILKADDRALRWLSVYGQFIHEKGVPVRSAGMVIDVTDQKSAEADAAQSRRRLERIGQATPSLIHIFDRFAGKSVWVNGNVQNLMGYSPEEVMAMGPGESRSRVHPDDVPKILSRYPILEAEPDGHVVEVECRMKNRAGEYRWLLDRTVAFERAEDGTVTQTLSAAIDITERRRSQERQDLLVNELNHRVKNTLAIVQAIGVQTFKGDGIAAERRRAFESRLLALSGVHNLLTRDSWEGAELGAIVAESIAPHDPGGERFITGGPPLALTPGSAVSVALALHELCTNAAKYGALSVDGGTVRLQWDIEGHGDERLLNMEWREEGGPPVSAPAARGFGSRLIERGLFSDMSGNAKLDFAPEGLRCRVQAKVPMKRSRASPLSLGE